jgi:FkbM family methyltransferase
MTERTYGSDKKITEYQLGETGVPSQAFSYLKCKNPNIIMVGAHDGVLGEQYGFMAFLEEIEYFNLYLLEPIKKWFDLLNEVYGKFDKKVKYLNYAISDVDGQIEMIDMGCMSKIGAGGLKVNSKKWDTFISDNNISNIDLLLLDCEGYEFEIISNIDYEINSPKIIRYEYYHISEQYKLDQFLISKGYRIELDQSDPTYNKISIKIT